VNKFSWLAAAGRLGVVREGLLQRHFLEERDRENL
jgi:hypothetical protein